MSMALSSLRSRAATAQLHDEQGPLRSAACPMCHTPSPLTQSALDAGGEWRCVRCGQHWDARRLAAVAAYAAWVVEYDDRKFRERAEGYVGAALSRDPPTMQLRGKP